MQIESFVFEIFPTEDQKKLIHSNFSAADFVYNKLLEMRNSVIEKYKDKSLTRREQKKHIKANRKEIITELKSKDFPGRGSYAFLKKDPNNEFLKKADSNALLYSSTNLYEAFKRFNNLKLRDAGFPHFKSRYDSQRSYTTIPSKKKLFNEDMTLISLPKIPDIAICAYRKFPENSRIIKIIVRKESTERYFVSICFEYEKELLLPPAEISFNKVLGLDYAANGLYIDSNGHCAHMPKFYKKTQEKLVCAQKRLSELTPGSNNYKKQKIKIAKIQYHIKNQRNYYQYNIIKRSFVADSNIHAVSVEGMNMKNIAQMKHQGKSTNDNAFGSFREKLQRKLTENGKYYVEVDQYYSSSKLCNNCGYKKEDLTLNVRSWSCPECGMFHDRDINAAKNIQKEGFRLLQEKLFSVVE